MSENESTAKARARLLEDYRRTFKSPHGKRVLEDLLAFTGVFSECQTAKDEGRRVVGLQILACLDKRNLAGLLSMEKEGVGLTGLGEEFYNVP